MHLSYFQKQITAKRVCQHPTQFKLLDNWSLECVQIIDIYYMLVGTLYLYFCWIYVHCFKHQLSERQTKLHQLQSSDNRVDVADMISLYRQYTKIIREWQSRRHSCLDMVELLMGDDCNSKTEIWMVLIKRCKTQASSDAKDSCTL